MVQFAEITGYTTNSASSDEAAAVAGDHVRVNKISDNLDDDETDSSGSGSDDDDDDDDDDDHDVEDCVEEVREGREFNLFLKKLLEDPSKYKAYIDDLEKENPEIKKLIFMGRLGWPLRNAMRFCISSVWGHGLKIASRRALVEQSEEFKEFKEMMHKEPNNKKAHCKKFKENNPFAHMMFFEDPCFSLYDAYPHPANAPVGEGSKCL